MSFVLLKNIDASTVMDSLEETESFSPEFVEIDTLYNAEKVEFLIENIDKIDIDKFKELVK